MFKKTFKLFAMLVWSMSKTLQLLDEGLDKLHTDLRVFQRVGGGTPLDISRWKYSFLAFCCKETTRFL